MPLNGTNELTKEVDDLLELVAGLMDALHSMVDMHILAMSRFHSLAEHTGFETPEGPEFASERGSRVHEMLAEWEARVTGQEYVPSPLRRAEPKRTCGTRVIQRAPPVMKMT